MRREGEAQMPTNSSKNSRSSGGRREKVTEKSSSFNGRTATVMGGRELRRLSTLPNLWSDEQGARPLLRKLLLNVVVQGSVGALHVLTTSDSSVGDLICLALRQYGKEGRRPILPSGDPSRFDLHYSQFSLDSLDRDEKLINLGSRNFFLCRKLAQEGVETASSSASSSCSEQAEKAAKTSLPWLKFMDFLF